VQDKMAYKRDVGPGEKDLEKSTVRFNASQTMIIDLTEL
jgi:hypothetical protein